MKKTLPFCFRSFLLSGVFLMMSIGSYANHILGMDLAYTWVSGNTYQITLTAYGDCGNSSFPSLSTAAPTICIYNGNASVTTVTLTIVAPTAGTEITPVCIADTAMTTCTSTTLTIAGVKKFVYTGTYTVSGTSAAWRFIFNGNMGGSYAGRSSNITNTTGGVTEIQLIDTLNNTTTHNSSPNLTVVPTPYFCLNNDDNYNPGAIDPDADSLRFYLVAGKVGQASTSCTLSGTTVAYAGGITATAPLFTNAGTFSFDPGTGQIAFNPNATQLSLVDYNIEEYRGGVLVGTSQREMTFLVKTCTNTPANGPMSAATNGTITDSTHFHICQNTGAFSFNINPTETNPTANIKITASSLPAGSTFIVTGDSTNAPSGNFSWTSNGTTPGTYTFFLYFKDDNCPIAGTNSVAYNVTISPIPVITGVTTVCATSTITLSNSVPGGTWSSGNSSIATVVAGTGVVTGINTGVTPIATTINYTSPAGCLATTTVTVNPLPAAIVVGSSSICVGYTTVLSDATTGGTWSSNFTTVATVTPGPASTTTVTGVAGPGAASIIYTLPLTGCSVNTVISVNPVPLAIIGTPTVCVGSITNLSDITAGGTWSSSNTFATVNSSSGGVTGQTAGTAVISYILGTGCSKTTTVTINATPAAIAPAGPVSACIGNLTPLSDATPGGTWSSSLSAIATVGTTGIVTGVSAGSANISYTNASGCSVIKAVSIISGVAAITPNPASVCTANIITLSDANGGGAWSSSNTALATVNPVSGVVTGVTNGTVNIIYTVGSCYTTATVTVNTTPVAISPATAVSLCIGGSAPLSDASGGGTWSSSNTAVVTVSPTGVVTGVAVGTVNISYINAAGCYAIKVVTVNSTPTAISPNPATVCTGFTVTLSDGVSGGTWSTSNAAVATIGSLSGIVSAVITGSVTITYAIGTCAVTSSVTVNPSPTAIIPAAAVSICIGSAAALSDATAGGVWSSSSSALATVTTPGGVVTGVANGVPVITYTNGGCFATKTVTVNTAPTAISPNPATVCVGTTVSLSDAITGGAWNSSNTVMATVDPVSGIVTGASVGNISIIYNIGSCFVTASLTVNPAPSAGTISGATSICVGGSAIPLSDAVAGGVWSSGSPFIATISASGVVTSVSVGTAIISYTVASSCGPVIATYTVTVSSASGGAGVIGGPTTICAGTFTTLTETVPGGAWTASNADATISSTGLLTGITPGIDIISYSVTNACGSFVATMNITIGAFLTSGTISGVTTLCAGTAIPLSDDIPGGVWSSTNTTVATISGVGVVSGVSGGATVISYLMISSCGSTASTYTVTVNPLPAAGTITGPSTMCAGTFTMLSDATPGGVWSSTNLPVATITSGGLLSGITAGTTTISYTYTNSCGTIAATKLITVNPAPGVGSIAGPSLVCVGTTISLTDATPGGVWSSSNARATVSATGVVTGVSVGADTITYSVTITCGTITATKIITVNPGLSAGTITGPSSVCVSSLIGLSDATPGGAWSSSNGHATVTTGGIVTGVTPGTDTISYTVFSSCGTVAATKIITITPSSGAGTITGATGVCPGSVITLSDPVPGGVWSSGNTAVATIAASGVVTGVNIGSATIYYTIVGSCGTTISSVVISVSSGPVVGAISGPSNVCAGSSISLIDATGGGVWSAANGNATVSGGLVTGVTAGTDVISYSVTNICGTAVATYVVTVVTYPVVTLISGPSSVCVGSSVTLADGSPGGVWSSTNTNATVNTSGLVTGVAVGSDVITYLLTNACGTVGTSTTITINPVANAGAITGNDSVCVGAAITLVDLAPGGVWSAGNANATVTGGVVTGVTGGTVPISYSVTNICGMVSAIKIVTVVAAPFAGTITGPSSVCIGSGITMVDTAPGGVWLSSNSNATVVAPGIVDGVAMGYDTVFYLVNNMCGAAIANMPITVYPIPVVTAISGPTNQCVGTIITLSDATPGGQWFSSNPSAAAVGLLTGIANGLSAGIVNITYTVTNVFGCPASAVYPDTVNAVPVTSPIAGSTAVCIGSVVALSDATPGGVWSSSNTLVATVDAAGMVAGITTGTTVISYTVVNICGTTIITRPETVNPLPVIAAISGSGNMCVGASVTLLDATSGGAWSSSNTAVATIGAASGIVTGVSAGSVNINYTVTSGVGCSASVISAETVNTLPVVAAISGAINVCTGGTSALSDATPGGVWSSGNTAIATVNAATGVVSGVSGGVSTIAYTVTNGPGCTASATISYIVNTMPVAPTVSGVMTVCAGATTTLSNSVPGGVWSSSNGNATVSPAGVVTGVSAGTDYIIYTVSNPCGSVIGSGLVTINALPVVNPITAPYSAICSGTTVSLTESTTGGIWSSSNTTIGTVSNTGVVTGLAVGIVTIRYMVTNSSGCVNVASILISVSPALPSAAVLPAGGATLCHGNPVYMHVVTTGGGLTYQWLLGGAMISGATNLGYTTGIAGSYSVIISNGTCSETLTGPVVVVAPNPVISFNPPDMLYTGSFTSYQWYLNGILIPGANTNMIHETGAGNYTVIVTDVNGCSDTSAGFPALSVNMINPVQDIKVYPNPVTSILHIDAPLKVNVSVLSIDGKLLISKKDAVNVDVHDLSNGMYIIMIYDEENIFLKTTKFAKTE